MARQDQIDVGHMNFYNADAVSDIVEQLKKRELPISVLDLSNVWWKTYIKPEAFSRLLFQFDEIAKPDSYLLTTDQPLPALLFRRITDRTLTAWTYQADTFERIRSYGSMEKFVAKFHKDAKLKLGLNNLSIRRNVSS